MTKYLVVALVVLAAAVVADRYLLYNGFFSNTFSCEFESEKEADDIATRIFLNLPAFSKTGLEAQDITVRVAKVWASDGENTANVEFLNKTDGGKIATMYLTESQCDMYVEYAK